MSWNPALDPDIPLGDAVDAIETVIVPRARDLGGFEVRRALPSARRQMVGPFIFLNMIGIVTPSETMRPSHDQSSKPTEGIQLHSYVLGYPDQRGLI
ncbi:Pirin domain protein [Rhodobacter sphaeroides]|jgi:hypothetical protein|nr:Pirin domain protein [Cereibacter sphaeroides]AXC61387.1 Pirin domain protein [Cereibacter sphaeroides 2.4.1]EKX56495.1 Pirin domain protein [Rhodobacter sp. AKP1]ANS34187.1 Pirin domain protein [Cereibacter sphaeroides]ATN63232.1 Pirin domain protein [Cereibacter sphaeroides]